MLNQQVNYEYSEHTKYSYGYLEVADDIKINAIYTMAEDEIKEIIVDYTPGFKAEFRQQG